MTPSTLIPTIPESAPFNAEQRAWIDGYLAGLFGSAPAPRGSEAAAAIPETPAEPLLILYGSQTGTAEALARELSSNAGSHGFRPEIREMNACKPADLAGFRAMLLVTSTWGDGDPPDNAVEFWNELNTESAPRLDQIAYSVLALGDRSYSEFCGAGIKFDQRLEALGARRIHPRTDCDLGYEEPAEAWSRGVWASLSKFCASGTASAASGRNGSRIGNGHDRATSIVDGSPVRSGGIEAPKTVAKGFDGNRPFHARLKTNRRLNGAGSAKDTRHFEIDLSGSGLTYECGDALGVIPGNCPDLVDELVNALGCSGEEPVPVTKGGELTLSEALRTRYLIGQPPMALVQELAVRCPESKMASLVNPDSKAMLDAYLLGRDVLDLLREHPRAGLTPGDLIKLLRPLQARLYSIASSPRAVTDEVHLTVAVVRYNAHGRERKGVCSTFLADRVTPETAVPVFVQSANGFRVPADDSRPMIMVGPGTGIAPFRAFLQEREARGGGGRNWLFFGDQHESCDFLYRDELQAWAESGVLTRLDTAFSRDQERKVYVQDRMIDQAAELWDWLEAGAHFYVCGDAKRMAKDVDRALHHVVEKAGGRTGEQAVEYVKQMKSEKRYQRDVY